MLKQTIKSILEQTYKDFELLIIDNYSEDDTEKVVKNIKDSRIKYLKNRNGGLLAVNRNFAIKNSKGEYIAICDDDDLWHPTKLEKQIKEVEKDKKIALVCTNAVQFNNNGETGSINKKRDVDFSFEYLLKDNSIFCSSVLVRKSVLKDVGYFDENPIEASSFIAVFNPSIIDSNRLFLVDRTRPESRSACRSSSCASRYSETKRRSVLEL